MDFLREHGFNIHIMLEMNAAERNKHSLHAHSMSVYQNSYGIKLVNRLE